MFWDPAASAHVLQLIAVSASPVAGTHQVHLAKIPGLRKSVMTLDGSHHFLYQDGNYFLQLRIRGSRPSKWAHLLTEALVAPDVLTSRLHHLEALNRLWHTGTVPGRRQSTAPYSDRLCFILRALDGSLAGASYREIAMVLIGADRVRADWRNDNDHLKNRIRRAVGRGRMLMKGGYRHLLVERRSSREFSPF